MIFNNNELKFYIDNKKDNTTKYIIYDNNKNCYYTAFVDCRKKENYNLVLKFRLTACYKIFKNNLTKYNFNRFEQIINNEINFAVDFNKLYLR